MRAYAFWAGAILLLLAAALVGQLLARPVVSPFWDSRVVLPHASPSGASR